MTRRQEAKLPERIKIGAHWWTIKHDSIDVPRMRDENVYGESDEKTFTIAIDYGRAHERQAETLLHEIYHAIQTTWLLPKDRSDEAVVKATTAGLLQVLRDNPEVVKFILKVDMP